MIGWETRERERERERERDLCIGRAENATKRLSLAGGAWAGAVIWLGRGCHEGGHLGWGSNVGGQRQ